MEPLLKSKQIVLASSLIRPKQNSIVIIKYKDKELIKKLSSINSNRTIEVVGQNTKDSIDSRHFGSLKLDDVIATVFWPISSGA